jgi:uncharacterized protein (TIGR02145 family)
MKNLILFIFLSSLLIVSSCSKDENTDPTPPGNNGTVTDIDGNTYATVQIGTQNWMKENLRTTKYRNGDVIPTGLSSTQWINATSGAWAYYDDNSQYNNPYGKLYNWYAVADIRGLCPSGWHVPSESEWKVLVKYLDPQADTSTVGEFYSGSAGGDMKTIGELQSGTGLWANPNTGANNSSGFSGLPGGIRTSFYYSDLGTFGYWWSTSDETTSNSDYYSCAFKLSYDEAISAYYEFGKNYGFSVRCIRD